MAVSYAKIDGPKALGNKYVSVVDVTLDSSYPTGGEAIDAVKFGLSNIEYASAQIRTPAGSVNMATASYAPATDKLLIYDESPAEIANEADVGNTVVRVTATGV